MKAFFLSDIHLRDPSESNSELLLLFLSQVLKDPNATHLFLVGDIFDLWIENHAYFVDRYATIISVVRNIVERGIEVHYFEGNHDLYLDKFWQQDVGARVHDGPSFFQLAHQTVRVEHGDQMNPQDRGYLFLRWFLRTPVMVWVARYLPTGWIRRIGENASSISRSYSSGERNFHEQSVRKMMRTHAHKAFEQKPFDLLISGHTHVHDEHEWTIDNGKTARAVNLGSWFGPAKVFVLDDKGGEFVSVSEYASGL